MKKVILRNVAIALSLLLTLVSFQNCGQVQNSVKFSSNGELVGTGDPAIDPPDVIVDPITPQDPSVENPPDDTVVCGGLGNDDGDEIRYGIKGSIFTSSKESDPKSAVKYSTDATPVTNANGDLINIYLNNLNVPERRFNQGFYSLNGDALKDNNGNVLIEYFGLKLEYTLTLPETMQVGYYHFAIESDDGAVLKALDTDNSYKTIINNDGQHATQTKCTSKAIYLDHNSKIPSQVYYYQGPREHIALRLAWKKVADENASSGCGALGSADGEPSTDQWSIIPSVAYERSGYVQTPNPCVK